MKVNSSLYKGIQYVQVNALPPDQKERLLKTINPELLIMIMVEGSVIRNCLQFKDYEAWFDNVYMNQSSVIVTTQSLPADSMSLPTLAFKKN